MFRSDRSRAIAKSKSELLAGSMQHMGGLAACLPKHRGADNPPPPPLPSGVLCTCLAPNVAFANVIGR